MLLTVYGWEYWYFWKSISQEQANALLSASVEECWTLIDDILLESDNNSGCINGLCHAFLEGKKRPVKTIKVKEKDLINVIHDWKGDFLLMRTYEQKGEREQYDVQFQLDKAKLTTGGSRVYFSNKFFIETVWIDYDDQDPECNGSMAGKSVAYFLIQRTQSGDHVYEIDMDGEQVIIEEKDTVRWGSLDNTC